MIFNIVSDFLRCFLVVVDEYNSLNMALWVKVVGFDSGAFCYCPLYFIGRRTD